MQVYEKIIEIFIRYKIHKERNPCGQVHVFIRLLKAITCVHTVFPSIIITM